MPTLLEVNRQLHLADIMKSAEAYAGSVVDLVVAQASDDDDVLEKIGKAGEAMRASRFHLELKIKTILEAYEATCHHHQ